MRICMMVTNGGAEDARVVREAASLCAAGHEVDVVAIVKERTDAPYIEHESGVRFHRTYWRADAFRDYLTELRTFWTTLAVVVLVIALAGLGLTALLFGADILEFARGAGDRVDVSVTPPNNAEAGPLLTLDRLVVIGGFVAGAVVLLAALGAAGYLLARFYQRVQRAFGSDAGVREEEDYYKKKMLALLDKTERMDGIAPFQPTFLERVPEVLAGIYYEPTAWLGLRPSQLAIWRHRSHRMAELAISLKPDVIHVHDVVTLPAGVEVKTRLGIPLVYEAHEIYDSVNSEHRGVEAYFGHLQRKHASDVDHFITTNQSAALFYKYAYPGLPPAMVIKNAVDAPEKAPVYDGRLHDAAGLSHDTRILLFQGGLNPNRGLVRLVQSAALLKPGWAIVFMGDGPLKPELVALYSELKRSARGRVAPVVFLPPVDREVLLEWTAGGALGIIPYEDVSLNHWYCTPNKLWEYPAAGVPLLVQPFPELSAVVDTYECGFKLAKSYTPLSIAESVNKISDDDLAEAKAKCLEFIAKDNWSVYADMLVDFYENWELPKRAASAAASRPAAPASLDKEPVR
ncbi:MAG: glycosyltransferase family 4 protein [Oceanicaulis sp.]